MPAKKLPNVPASWDHTKPAAIVVSAFGGVVKTARILGRTKGAVSMWQKKGAVPPKLWARIQELSDKRALGIQWKELSKGRP